MANYGIGGQYEPHYDYSRREKDLYNNRRIATWLSYLSTVEQGGGTVFTTAGIHIRSLKGTAVFWYNLLPNGSGDIRTRHAACPVLKGNKWVSNKWIHEFGNEFKPWFIIIFFIKTKFQGQKSAESWVHMTTASKYFQTLEFTFIADSTFVFELTFARIVKNHKISDNVDCAKMTIISTWTILK